MKSELSLLARAMVDEIKARPQQFHELADAHREVPWPQFLRTWGELRRAGILRRDEDGNYLIAVHP
jgi:DNA-binding transcriptional ArsR family regulator